MTTNFITYDANYYDNLAKFLLNQSEYYTSLTNTLVPHLKAVGSRSNRHSAIYGEYSIHSLYSHFYATQSTTKIAENQKLYVLRHGERVDSIFGPGWTQYAFDSNGQYIRFDANMPRYLIARENPYEYDFDPPLTEQGLEQARLYGESLARSGVKITHMYSSPALRSIQTADKILEGMNLKGVVPIRIETGLFELLSWQYYIPHKYPFINHYILRNNGYNVDLNYYPIMPYEHLRKDENIDEYYVRCHYVTKTIVDRHAHEGGNIMMVGHAPTLEGCTRQLVGNRPRNLEEFTSITRQVSFLSMAQCEKDGHSGQWKLIRPKSTEPRPVIKSPTNEQIQQYQHQRSSKKHGKSKNYTHHININQTNNPYYISSVNTNQNNTNNILPITNIYSPVVA